MPINISVKPGFANDMGVVKCPSCYFPHKLTIPLRVLIANAKVKVKLECGCEVDTLEMVKRIREAT